MPPTPQHTRIATAYLALRGQGGGKVSVRALRERAKVSTAAAAEFLRNVSSSEDYALSGLDTDALLSSVLESLAEQARVKARSEMRDEIIAAQDSEALALEANDRLTEQLREAQLRAAADAATIAALREQITNGGVS